MIDKEEDFWARHERTRNPKWKFKWLLYTFIEGDEKFIQELKSDGMFIMGRTNLTDDQKRGTVAILADTIKAVRRRIEQAQHKIDFVVDLPY